MIDPTRDTVRTFMQEDDGAPIVMLNLLRFAPDGGEEGYARYVAHFTPHAEAVGAEVIYLGRGGSPLVAETGQDWDAVLLVRYPSRQAFMDMVRDPDYAAGVHLRSGSLVEAVLQPTVAWSPATGDAERPG